MGLSVHGAGCRVQGFECGVPTPGSGVNQRLFGFGHEDGRSKIYGLVFVEKGVGFRVSGVVFVVQGFGCRVLGPGSGVRVQGPGSGVRVRGEGPGSRVWVDQ